MRDMRSWQVGTIFMLSSFALGITIPVLSLMLLDKGLDLSSLAVALGAYSLVVVLAEIPSGVISDRYGRKICFLLAKFCTAGGSLILVWADSLPFFLLAILLLGLARACISGSLEALAIDWHNLQFGTHALHRISTRISIWETVGLSAGSLAAGVVTIWSQRLLPLSGTYDGNFVLSGALNLITGILAWIWITEPKQPAGHQKPDIGFRPVIRLIVSNGMLAAFVATSFSTGIILSSLEKYWQPRLEEIAHGTGDSVSLVLGVLAFVGFMGALVGTLLSGRFVAASRGRLLTQFMLWRFGMMLAVVLLVRSASMAGFTVFYGVFYVFLGLAGIAEQVAVNRLIPDHLRASVLSTNSFSLQTGGLLASGFAAWYLADHTRGIGGVWTISATVIVVALVPFLLYGRRWREQLGS